MVARTGELDFGLRHFQRLGILFVAMVVVTAPMTTGVVTADSAYIKSLQIVNGVDNDGDGRVSSFQLRINADTQCMGCNDEKNDDIEPYFEISVTGSNGNSISRTVEVNRNNNDYSSVVDLTSETNGFDAQTLTITVTLMDRDYLIHDRLDTKEIRVQYEPRGADTASSRSSSPKQSTESSEQAQQPPDTDSDGLTDSREQTLGTDLKKSDTDGDGLDDSREVEQLGTDPTRKDTDGDGLPDGIEVDTHGSDPTKVDSDGDGLTDAREVAVRSNPNSEDTDQDGLSDSDELRETGTEPDNDDSDGDGLKDGREATDLGTDPLNKDTDGDGVDDGTEVTSLKSNPQTSDTDQDGLTDKQEATEIGTDPTKMDTDRDGLSDAREVRNLRTDPTHIDTDNDGIGDGREVRLGLNALSSDTDGDILSDDIDPAPKAIYNPLLFVLIGVTVLVVGW